MSRAYRRSLCLACLTLTFRSAQFKLMDDPSRDFQLQPAEPGLKRVPLGRESHPFGASGPWVCATLIVRFGTDWNQKHSESLVRDGPSCPGLIPGAERSVSGRAPAEGKRSFVWTDALMLIRCGSRQIKAKAAVPTHAVSLGVSTCQETAERRSKSADNRRKAFNWTATLLVFRDSAFSITGA